MSSISNNLIEPPLKKQKLEQQEKSYMDVIPDEILFRIFDFLSLSDLFQTVCVCWRWNTIAIIPSLWEKFDLKKHFPKVNFIDQDVWETHVNLTTLGLSFDDAHPINKRLAMVALNKLSYLKMERNNGITLATIPAGLSLNKLIKCVGSPKQGNKTGFLFLPPSIKRIFGDITTDKTFRVAITNAPLVGSTMLTNRESAKFLNERGCEMPQLLPMTSVIFLTYISSRYPQHPNTLFEGPSRTHLLESYKEGWDENVIMKVGSFNYHGVDLSDIKVLLKLDVARQGSCDRETGVCAQLSI